MYARVTYVQAPDGEGKVDEGLDLWHDNVLSITRQMPGWQGVVSLVDRKTGKSIAITLWDTEEHMLASTKAKYHQDAIARFGEFFEKAPHAPENYEVDLAEVHGKP